MDQMDTTNGKRLAETVGQNVMRILMERRISQKKLAEGIHVSERTLYRYLYNGVNSLVVLAEIADFLGVRVGVLLGESPD